MASIQKRGKTYQYTVSRVVDGKSKPIRKGGFRTRSEAQIAAAEVEVQLKKGIVPHLQLQPFDEYFIKWVSLYKTHLSPSTKLHYDYTLKAIRTHFGSKPLQQIKRHDYQLFLNNFGSNKSRETISKVHTHIRSCVQDAIEEQIIQHDFTRKAVITYGNHAKKASEKHLNIRETEMLANKLQKRLSQGLGYYLLLLGLSSGLRYGELVGLTKSDFNFQENTISVEKTWGYMKRSHNGFGLTKNRASIRTIRIDGVTMAAFKRLLDKMPNTLHDLVFYSQSSKYKVISNNNANKLLKNTLISLGIPNIITMHGLRHTHASYLLYNNISIQYISERLGHKDIDTTYKVYAHITNELREEDEKKTLEIFNKIHQEENDD